ncbi:hypothetical protein DRJ16_05965 [Candidatus Woesearchaeota archaeon]|nr:MAG: hypothetical protein DRJ16_05965 [Candidatus Woesearchaeota archaeon]
MDRKWKRVIGILIMCFFIFSGSVWAAKLKITIDPKTGKPIVKSDVPVVSKSVSPTGWVMLTLSTGEKVGYFVDPTGVISTQVFSGAVEVVVGNTVAKMEAGEAAAIKTDPVTKTVQVVAQKGVIEVAAQGKRIKIKAGQQTRVSPGAPPAPPAAAPPTIAAPPAPAPAPAPVTPAAVVVAPAVVTPPPPKYQVSLEVTPPPPAPKIEVEEFHGQRPASPAE